MMEKRKKAVCIFLFVAITASLITSICFWAVKNGYFSVKTANKIGVIQVRGNEECQRLTATALSELEKAPGRHLDYVRERIGIIECAEKGSGIYVWEKPPRFVVGERTYKTNTTLKLYASAIVHDACHVEQYYSGRSYSGEMAEKECLEKQYKALEEIGGTAEELELVRGALEKRYWEIPFEERSW